MPQAHGGPNKLVSPAEMEIRRGEDGVQSQKTSIATPDESMIRRKGRIQRGNKQNLDYVLKSGLAGGLAACTVS